MSKCVGMLTGDGWTTKIDYMRRVYSIDDVCPTIATVTGGGMELKILVKQQSNGRVYYKPVRGGLHRHNAADQSHETRTSAGRRDGLPNAYDREPHLQT